MLLVTSDDAAESLVLSQVTSYTEFEREESLATCPLNPSQQVHQYINMDRHLMSSFKLWLMSEKLCSALVHEATWVAEAYSETAAGPGRHSVKSTRKESEGLDFPTIFQRLGA